MTDEIRVVSRSHSIEYGGRAIFMDGMRPDIYLHRYNHGAVARINVTTPKIFEKVWNALIVLAEKIEEERETVV